MILPQYIDLLPQWLLPGGIQCSQISGHWRVDSAANLQGWVLNLLKKGVYDSSLSLSLSPHLTSSLLPLFLSLSLSLACKSIKFCKVRTCVDGTSSRCLECKPYTSTGYEVKLNRNGKKLYRASSCAVSSLISSEPFLKKWRCKELIKSATERLRVWLDQTIEGAGTP